MMPFWPLIVALTQDVAGTKREGIRQGFTLVATVVLIGLVLVVALLLFMAMRRTRRMREGKGTAPDNRAPVDPWLEAGRRAEPETKYISLATSADEVREEPAGPAPEPEQSFGPMGGDRPIAVVTGGARRVGKAICTSLVKSGCDLVLTYNTSVEAAREAAIEFTKLGAAVRLVRLPLEDTEAVERTGAMLARDLPRLDVLVHNASVYGPTPLPLLTPETALLFWKVNTLAPLLLTKHLAGRLSESPRPGGGAIVAMADIHAAGRPRKHFAAYSMSKAALVEMVQSLARELAPKVRVNAVAPGVVAWPEGGQESEAAKQAYVKQVPLERAGTPEEAAEAVRWLALDAHYTTGQVIRVDGGRFLS
jgi:pteridine reductase